MLSPIKKRQIIASYSNVLADVFLKDNYYDNLAELKNISTFLKKNNSNGSFTPEELRKYKTMVNDILSKSDKNNEIQQFLMTILKRRYGFLLSDIIENTEIKLQNKLQKTKFCIRTSEEISDKLKKNIENTISKQIEKSEIKYEIDRNIKKDNIDFISNGNVCSLNLNFFLKD